MRLGKKPLTRSSSSRSSSWSSSSEWKNIQPRRTIYVTRPRRPFNADPATNTPRPRPAATTLKGATEQLDGHKENAIFRGGHNECVKVYCSQRRRERKLANSLEFQKVHCIYTIRRELIYLLGPKTTGSNCQLQADQCGTKYLPLVKGKQLAMTIEFDNDMNGIENWRISNIIHIIKIQLNCVRLRRKFWGWKFPRKYYICGKLKWSMTLCWPQMEIIETICII